MQKNKSQQSEDLLMTEMVEYYRQRAESYESIYYRDNPIRRQEIADEVSRISEQARGKRVIELACGTGYWTAAIAQTAKEIIACDTSSEMLAIARQKPLQCPVQFLNGDMFRVKELFQDANCTRLETAELVVAGFWHSHQPKQLHAEWFTLLHSLCAPNGKIWLIDNNPPAEGEGVVSHGVDSHGNNLKQRELPDGSIHRIVKNYFSREQIQTQFAAEGDIESLEYGTYYWSVVYRPFRISQ